MAHLFRKGHPGPVWLAVLLLASLGLYLADARLHLLDHVRGWLMAGAEPVQRLAALPAQLWRNAVEATRSRAEMQDELARLGQENLLLKAQMQTFWALQEENRRLRNILHATQPLEQDLLLAESIPVKGDARRQMMLINRGSRDGIFVGQAVLAAEGLLGQVVHVGPRTAEILLLTDDTHAIPVRIARTGQRAIARGTGQGDRMDILHLPNNADVREGDLLVTSGLGGTFPAGYPVASVSVIAQAQSGPFASISARPLAPVDDVREVILVWMRDASSTDIPSPDPAHAP
ncbi:MAG: rod shape-determining protein MreC [Stenotrophomonas sp.]|uniref:rod shape-determining protein MreC n=1 Tax=Stenotrophomonas sp. TaxID=69392 RepID=UPI0019A85E68|nr:rod shape-determining protein MreC [Stenotrophomonas sp.]MBD3743429.1 rod shape-determining protein MreC [Stenotrophomonas sp.]